MIPDDWEAKWCWQTENCGQKVNSQRQHCDVGCQEAKVEQKLHLQLLCVNGQWSANHKLLSLVNKVSPPIKGGTNQFSKLTSPASISTCQTWLSGWEKKPLINQLSSNLLSTNCDQPACRGKARRRILLQPVSSNNQLLIADYAGPDDEHHHFFVHGLEDPFQVIQPPKPTVF